MLLNRKFIQQVEKKKCSKSEGGRIRKAEQATTSKMAKLRWKLLTEDKTFVSELLRVDLKNGDIFEVEKRKTLFTNIRTYLATKKVTMKRNPMDDWKRQANQIWLDNCLGDDPPITYILSSIRDDVNIQDRVSGYVT